VIRFHGKYPKFGIFCSFCAVLLHHLVRDVTTLTNALQHNGLRVRVRVRVRVGVVSLSHFVYIGVCLRLIFALGGEVIRHHMIMRAQIYRSHTMHDAITIFTLVGNRTPGWFVGKVNVMMQKYNTNRRQGFALCHSSFLARPPVMSIENQRGIRQ